MTRDSYCGIMPRQPLYREAMVNTTIRLPVYDVHDAHRLGINMSQVARDAIHAAIMQQTAYIARRRGGKP